MQNILKPSPVAIKKMRFDIFLKKLKSSYFWCIHITFDAYADAFCKCFLTNYYVVGVNIHRTYSSI